jgi:hypothetical protein
MSSALIPTGSPELTTLKSLQRYASHQTDLINSLPSKCFRDPSGIFDWAVVLKATWGKGLDSYDATEKVERGSDVIDGSLVLPNIVPNDRDVMLIPEVAMRSWSSNPKYKKILIRSEYKEAEEFALTTCGMAEAPQAFVVVGQSGIGFSPFYSATTEL